MTATNQNPEAIRSSGATPPLPRGSETVLVVDDDEDVRRNVARVLRRLGYKVMEAGTPENALRIVKMSGIDLLVVDVILPTMSGLAVAASVASLRPAARILYMSGYRNEDVLSEVREDTPGVGFIAKPFDPSDLARSVRDLLDEAPPKKRVPPPIPRGSESLLVVEDDAGVRRNVVRLLERLGYRVLQAQDPDHALRIALQSRVDLILMDVVLPRLDGLSLAHTISSLRPKTGVLYMSGYSEEELADEHGIEATGVGFLHKPFTAEDLGRSVRRLLDAQDARAWGREPGDPDVDGGMHGRHEDPGEPSS